MAVVQNPLIGRGRNSVGNIIFYTSKGQNIIRSKPISYGDAKSPAQLLSRSIFLQVNSLARLFLPVIQISLKPISINQSEYTRFISLNRQFMPSDGSNFNKMNLTTLNFGIGSLYWGGVFETNRDTPVTYTIFLPEGKGINNMGPNAKLLCAVYIVETNELQVNYDAFDINSGFVFFYFGYDLSFLNIFVILCWYDTGLGVVSDTLLRLGS